MAGRARAVPALDRLVHLASFLLVSHPTPVRDAIAHFRDKLDRDPLWLEDAAFGESEGRPFAAVKQALAQYVGGKATEIGLTPNTTTALAMVYHGLRIRANQEIVTKRLSAQRIRTSHSPYKVSYARVATGVMNIPGEIDQYSARFGRWPDEAAVGRRSV